MNAQTQMDMSIELPDLAAIDQTRREIQQHYPATSSIRWPLLAQKVGADIVVKHENHTCLGAFKGRGGLTLMSRLRELEPQCPGVISATRGNHGQSLAYAAAQYGLRTVILVPHGNSVEKNAAMRALGAELIEFGEDFQSATEEAGRQAEAYGLKFVPPFHVDLLLGVATYWREFFEMHPDLDRVYVPVGMGSGICSAICVRDLMGLKTKIFGVVAEQAPAYLHSFRQGCVVSQPAATKLADGLACSKPNETALAMMLAGVENFLAVSEAAIADAMALYFQATHNVAEGAAAAALAAVMQDPTAAGLRIGLPLTGGNVDANVFADVLRRAG